MANFRTKARAIDLLGKNQIADLPTAITELWKNGYDAYGDYLDARLYEEGYKDITSPVFVISDDGHGMTSEDILNKWIVIGTDSKRNENHVVPEEDRFGKKIRVPLGEKGIGRLSVTYLGNHMIMVTKKKDNNAQMLFMNWRVMENYEMFLDDVEIPVASLNDIRNIDEVYADLQKEYYKNFDNDSWENFQELKNDIYAEIKKYSAIPHAVKEFIVEHFTKFGHGTLFIILDPIKDIVDLQLEKQSNIADDREDIRNQIDYVKSALSGLFNPFDKNLLAKRKLEAGEAYKNPRFIIYTHEGEYNFLGEDSFTEDDFEACEHWIDGTFDEYGTFTGKIKVFGDIEDYRFVLRIKPRAYIGKLSIRVAFWEGLRKNSSMNAEKWISYDKKGSVYSGLCIYRDGFRVLPYGRTDFDFLEFEKNRSKSAGTAYFSHRKMFGFIGITKNENPGLIDKSGREGFVSNDTYKEFKRLLSGFFKKIAEEKYGTKSEARIQHLSEIEKEAHRKSVIADEKKKNRTAVIGIQKEITDNTEKMTILKRRVDKLYLEADVIKTNEEEERVLSEASNLISEASALSIVVPADISLYGYDSVNDRLTEYNEDRETIIDQACKLISETKSSIKAKVLGERYYVRSNEIQKEIVEKRKEVIEQIEKELGKVLKRIQSESAAYLEEIIISDKEKEELMQKTPGEITKSLYALEKKYREFLDTLNSSYKPLLQHLSRLSDGDNWGRVLSAYKTAEAELSRRLDEVYELAQVGMAIDVVDHQFNVLYEQISNNIEWLISHNNTEEYVDNLMLLKWEFQHMEDNHKMLMPLYRKTRKERTLFYGKDIESIILKFYDEIFKKNDIKLEATEKFKKYEYYSYESIVVPVFLNIVNNAVYWLGYVPDNRLIRLDVMDEKVLILNSGPRMKNTELTRCFELFYSKKESNSGRGIGLYLARRNLASVDMEIYATNDKDINVLGGACFVITKEDGEK